MQGDAPGAALANSSALAGAIAAVPHNGTVQVPAGRYLSLPVAMRGSMTLLLAPRCRVCGAAVAGGLAHPPRPRQRWPDVGRLGGPPRNLFRRAAHAIVARQPIRHCLMERCHGGVVIGSVMSGGITDVTVEHCHMAGTGGLDARGGLAREGVDPAHADLPRGGAWPHRRQLSRRQAGLLPDRGHRRGRFPGRRPADDYGRSRPSARCRRAGWRCRCHGHCPA